MTAGGAMAALRGATALAIMLMAVAGAAAQAPTVPTPRDKPAAAEAEEVPTVPTPTSCLRDLQDAGVVARRASGDLRDGQCDVKDPVIVEAVGTRAGEISLPGGPTLNCQFATTLADWLREVVGPVAHSVLGSPVAAVISGPGYQCRSRAGGRLSEHAIGYALDISEIRLVDGRSIPIETLASVEGAQLEFLRAISASACGYFTTVLGPGSDAAHFDHLHVDMAKRRTVEFRICMGR